MYQQFFDSPYICNHFLCSASNEYWNNVFMLATLLILAFAVFFLCCDTSSSTSSSHSREDEVLQMVHHDSAKPFEFETVPAEDEYGRPLRILRHDGMMATAPPLDHQNTPVHSYATFDRERRSPYAQPSLIIASTRGDQSETVPPPPPPPYRENSAFADMSFLQLPAAVDGLTSAQSRSIVRNTHPGSSGSSMVFVPR